MASKKFTQFDTANNTSETELSVGVKSGDNFKRLNFLTATTNPTVNDDNSDGYTVGSFWFNASTGVMYICKDSTIGAAVWTAQVIDLQGAYDGGNVVNSQTVTIDGTNSNFGVGFQALQGATCQETTAFGAAAGENSSGGGNNFAGSNAGRDNSGGSVNGFGANAAEINSGNNVNAFGSSAGVGNTANDCNFFGGSAGSNNQTAFGVTGFSLSSIPQYNDHAAAAAALTIANGCSATTVYIYLNTSNDTVGFVIPT